MLESQASVVSRVVGDYLFVLLFGAKKWERLYFDDCEKLAARDSRFRSTEF